MLRKCLTVAAVFAAITAGTAGVANASTPAPANLPTCTITVLSNCIGTGTHLGGNHGNRGGDFRGGFRGGNFGGGFGFADRYRGTYWNRGGVILPYDQVASSCGCSGDPVALGYQIVENPTTVLVAPATGDGSCVALSQVNWSLPAWHRGVRLFHRH